MLPTSAVNVFTAAFHTQTHQFSRNVHNQDLGGLTEDLSHAGHLLKCHELTKVNNIMRLDTPTNNFVYDRIKTGRQRNPVRDVENEQIERKENKKVETSRNSGGGMLWETNQKNPGRARLITQDQLRLADR